MSIEEKLKDYYTTINEAWQVMKKYATAEFDNDVWENVQVETDRIYNSHGKSKFTCEILIAVINELERIDKCTQRK